MCIRTKYMHLYSVELNRSQKTHLRTCAQSEDSDKRAYSHRQIIIFTGSILDSQGCTLSTRGQRIFCADAQTGLRLIWAHLSDVTFPKVAAFIINSEELV